MEKIERVQPLAGLILPRIETKRVSKAREDFKGALEKGREMAENRRNSADSKEKTKKDPAISGEHERKKTVGSRENRRMEKKDKQGNPIETEKDAPLSGSSVQTEQKVNAHKTDTAEKDQISEALSSENFEETAEEAMAEADVQPLVAELLRLQGETLQTDQKEETAVEKVGGNSSSPEEAVLGSAQIESWDGLEIQTLQSAENIEREAGADQDQDAENPLADKGSDLGQEVLQKSAERKTERAADKFSLSEAGQEVTEAKTAQSLPQKSVQEDIRRLMSEDMGFGEENELRIPEAEDSGTEIFGFPGVRVQAVGSRLLQSRTVSSADLRSAQTLPQRLIEEVRISLGQNKNEIKIQLHPETLGKLTIRLTSENGVMNASFFAENDKAKQMIEAQMAELRKTLETQGIQVQDLSVTVDSGKEELSRHKNIMEAKKYSKIKAAEPQNEILDALAELQNPYVAKDEFSEIV